MNYSRSYRRLNRGTSSTSARQLTLGDAIMKQQVNRASDVAGAAAVPGALADAEYWKDPIPLPPMMMTMAMAAQKSQHGRRDMLLDDLRSRSSGQTTHNNNRSTTRKGRKKHSRFLLSNLFSSSARQQKQQSQQQQYPRTPVSTTHKRSSHLVVSSPDRSNSSSSKTQQSMTSTTLDLSRDATHVFGRMQSAAQEQLQLQQQQAAGGVNKRSQWQNTSQARSQPNLVGAVLQVPQKHDRRRHFHKERWAATTLPIAPLSVTSQSQASQQSSSSSPQEQQQQQPRAASIASVPTNSKNQQADNDSTRLHCIGCSLGLECVDDCEFVVCPACQCVMDSPTPVVGGGVAMAVAVAKA